MLEFFSASTRMVNPQRAVLECLNPPWAAKRLDCDLVIVHASVGPRPGAGWSIPSAANARVPGWWAPPAPASSAAKG